MFEPRALMPPLPDAGKQWAAALTVLVHVLLGVFLFYGIRWQTQPPQAVSVELVSSRPVVNANITPVEETTPPVAEPKPEPKIEPKVQPHPVSPAKPDIAIKDKEKPKEKTKAREEPMFDPMKALRQETAKSNQARNESSVKNAAAQEQAASARGRAVQTYLGKIRDKVRGKITRLPGINGNPEAVFNVVQLPSGEILSVRLKKSSGNSALDAELERAIHRANPLPLPDQKDLFSRELNLTIRPLEE